MRLVILLLLILGACAKAPGPDSANTKIGSCLNKTLNGTWQNDLNILLLWDDCRGYHNLCDQWFTYTLPAANPGSATVTMIGQPKDPLNCLQPGPHQCQFHYTETTLSFDCGLGEVTYSKNNPDLKLGTQ